MNKIKKYSIIWGIIIILIFALLTIMGFIYKSKSNSYTGLENKLVDAAKKYVDAKFIYPTDDKILKITKEELIDDSYLNELKHNEEECIGYVNVKKSSTVYKYKGYIKCDNYQTKGYVN